MDMTGAVELHVMEIASVPHLNNWQPRSRCLEAGEELIICEYQTRNTETLSLNFWREICNFCSEWSFLTDK